MKNGVCLTRNGRPAGYLIPADEYEKFERHHPSAVGGGNGVEEVLAMYSLGKSPRQYAMQQIGISDYGLLLRLLNVAGLPHPTVRVADRRKLDQAFDSFMDAVEGTD